MKSKIKQNSGFSLIELIIAMAVLSFLMLAVSSFMGSSVMQNRKAKVDIKMQASAQETYGLITDTIMQASDIVLVGYEVADDSQMTFSNLGDDGKAVTTTATRKYYVRDKATADALIANPASYGITGSVNGTDVVLFSDLTVDKKIYVSSIRVESAVPLDMNQVPSGNPNVLSDQNIMNSLTNTATTVSCTVKGTERIYSINDTLVSTFCFDGNNLYYGRKYAYMTDLNDELDMTDSDSKASHLYNKYFSYRKASAGATDVNVSGCVATINAADETIAIDLYYNQSSMTYTTLGRISTRNTHVLKPRK